MGYFSMPVVIGLAVSSCWSAAAAAQTQGSTSCEETPLSQARAVLYGTDAGGGRDEPIELTRGPHLLIDDYYIASSRNVKRVVNVPQRGPSIANPIVTGKEDGCFQPYMTIIRDASTGRFRMWYGRHTDDLNTSRSRIGYLESADGIHWERPARTLPDPGPIQFGVSVIDEGAAWTDPSTRFKFAWWMDGLRIATSPDGFTWTPIAPEPVLRHNHDITGIFYDPLRKWYVATASVYRPGDTWQEKRRITMQSHSLNLTDWSPAHYVVLPDAARDEGVTQFYAMDGYLTRGELIIGMVKVLRDDLKADDPPDPPDAYGVGYTTLAWTRDGETWVRDPAPFFQPDPTKGAWDHAHAWIDDQVVAGDDVYLYYGGYARGHKVNRFEERQIGLVKIGIDRYAGRAASGETGTITTPLLVLDDGSLSVNVNAKAGALRVQVSDGAGKPVPGFTFAECRPITGDTLAAPVAWPRPLREAKGMPVRLEFELKDACLYAFTFN